MQKLLHPDMKVSAEFGGSLLWGKRIGKRPISTSKPMHLVLKSDVAVGKLSLTRYEAMIFLSKAKINKFWTQRIYTRIVEWGKALKHVEDI